MGKSSLKTMSDTVASTFRGWELAGEGIITSIPSTKTGDLELMAMWDERHYTLTYVSKGSTVGSEQHLYGEDADLNKTLDETNTEYFDGWSDTASSGKTISTITMDGDKTVYAEWSPKLFHITYYDGDKMVGDGDYTYGSTLALMDYYDTATHTFDGWYTAPGSGGTQVTSITATDYGDKEYYAHWTAKPITYTVLFRDTTGASGVQETLVTVTVGVDANAPSLADTGRHGSFKSTSITAAYISINPGENINYYLDGYAEKGITSFTFEYGEA